MAVKTSRAPKVLIVTTVHWPAATRLGLALSRIGFTVGAVAPSRHGLHRLGGLAAGFRLSPHVGLAMSVARAIEQWSPDIVVPGDDRALASLHRIHARAARGLGRDPCRMLTLIETSLGDPLHFDAIEKKSRFASLARAEGLTVPETVEVRNVDDLRRRLANGVFPRVLKVDGSWGGLGVRIVNTPAEAVQAFVDLAAPPGWLRIGKQIVQHLNFTPLSDRLCGQRPIVTLQDHVAGRPANRAVVCWKGEALAGLTVEVLQTSHPTGPASVVRIIDHPEIAEATRRLVCRLGISGFCGVDFILDAAGRAHAIELNARSTQICHLALDAASDMTGALYATITGTVQRGLAPIRHEAIAFFPQELWRDRHSKYLSSAYHDVPWEEPQMIAAYLEPDPPGWVDQLMQALGGASRLGRATPALADDDLGIAPIKREG